VHYGCQYVLPPFIKNLTRRSAAMSEVGSPWTAIRSARRPSFTRPSRVSRWKYAALPEVAAIVGQRRHAPLHHQLQLAHVVAVRIDADVAAEAHLDAGGQCSLECLPLARDPLRLGIHTLPPAGVLCGGVRRRERRAIRHALLHHQLPYLRRALVAMLDCLDAPNPGSHLSNRLRCTSMAPCRIRMTWRFGSGPCWRTSAARGRTRSWPGSLM